MTTTSCPGCGEGVEDGEGGEDGDGGEGGDGGGSGWRDSRSGERGGGDGNERVPAVEVRSNLQSEFYIINHFY